MNDETLARIECLTKKQAQQVIQLGAKMYDVRDTMRRALGPEKWAEAVAKWRPVVESVMKLGKMTELQAGSEIIRQTTEDGHEAAGLVALAVVVEMIEPSE